MLLNALVLLLLAFVFQAAPSGEAEQPASIPVAGTEPFEVIVPGG